MIILLARTFIPAQENCKILVSNKRYSEAHQGSSTSQGHKGLHETLTITWYYCSDEPSIDVVLLRVSASKDGKKKLKEISTKCQDKAEVINSTEIPGGGLHLAWNPRKNYNNIKERKRWLIFEIKNTYLFRMAETS